MAWARHGKCESDTAALCKSNGKDTFQTLNGMAWQGGRGMLCVWIGLKTAWGHFENGNIGIWWSGHSGHTHLTKLVIYKLVLVLSSELSVLLCYLFLSLRWKPTSNFIDNLHIFFFFRPLPSCVLDENFESPSFHSGHCCGREVANSS